MEPNDVVAELEGLLEQADVEDSEEQPEAEEVEQEEEVSEESDGEPEETEEEDEETAESEPDEGEEREIETVADLAEALELSPEEVMAKLKTTIKLNGEELPVTLSELVSGYQKDADYRRKTSEVAETRRQLDEQARQLAEYQEAQLIQLGRYVQDAEKQFNMDYNPQELAQLRQSDPGEYAAKVQEINQRQQQLHQLKSQAANTFAQVKQQQQAQQQQALEQALQRAAEELPTRIPNWSKETARQLDEYLMGDNFGYTAEDLQQVADPRLIELAWKAHQYDQQKATSNVVKKKVKTLPKLTKSSKPEGKATVKTSNLTKAKQRLAKTGKVADAASFFEQVL